MKKDTIPALITPFLLILSLVSCNDLKYETVPKKALQVSTQRVAGLDDHIDPAPDLMGAFLWPSEEYFERGRELGLFDESEGAEDYASYIERISHIIFSADDDFNKWFLLHLQRKKETAKELEETARKREALRSQIKVLNRKSKELKEQKKTLAKALENASEDEKLSYEGQLAALNQRISDAFREKRKLTQKLTPLKEREDALERYVQEALVHQEETSMVVQRALDPQSVSFVRDENGDKLTNEYGFPVRTIDEDAQVNWLKVYKENVALDNDFDIRREKITIRLGHWAGRAYETKYRQNDRGEWELHPESTIYDVSFSPDEVLTFKFRERDHRENETNRVFEFELQLSRFTDYYRLVGDIRVWFRGEIVRKGQLKAFLKKR